MEKIGETATNVTPDPEQIEMAVAGAIPSTICKSAPLPESNIVSAARICIYRVPIILRQRKESAYIPKVISIGPLHYNDPAAPELAKMEVKKKKYQQQLFARCDDKSTRSKFLEIVREKEDDIKACYEEVPSGFLDDEFAEMIVLDSSFIIELFLRNYDGHEERFKPWLECAIAQDLVLLENQIPYFIIYELYQSAFRHCSGNPTFEDLTFRYFKTFVYPDDDEKNNESRSSEFKYDGCCRSLLYCFWISNRISCPKQKHDDVESRLSSKQNDKEYCKHFTDFLRQGRYKIPEPEIKEGETTLKPEKREGKKGEITLKSSALKLHQSGVKIKKRFVTSGPLHIAFENGVLEIPPFQVDDKTEGTLRNLMAFEQCHYPNETYVCDYIAFMDCLINSGDDVELLVENDVIVNLLGDNQMVATLMNNLCLGISKGKLYDHIYEQLNRHCENWWYGTIATMRRVYFGDLWKGTGTIAALAVLIFTLITSINSIMEMIWGKPSDEDIIIIGGNSSIINDRNSSMY